VRFCRNSFQPCFFTGDISPKTENKNSQCENEVTFVIFNRKRFKLVEKNKEGCLIFILFFHILFRASFFFLPFFYYNHPQEDLAKFGYRSDRESRIVFGNF
jgi:hypothetical protein